MALNQNQFAQSPVQGMVALRAPAKLISCQVDSSEAGSLVAGQFVKLVDSAGGLPKVIAVAANTDVSFGPIAYNIKNATYKAGDTVEVMVGFDDVMWMTASAAIARGALLMPVVAGSKVVTATTAKPIIGWALDKAAADGDLIRVVSATPAYFNAP